MNKTVPSLQDLEKELDLKLEQLSIWELSFQSIISNLLLVADGIDLRGESDTAMDYVSRLSLIYPIIKKHSKESEVTTSTDSITTTIKENYISDINFLIAYAHFSMLMPQVYRGTMIVAESHSKKFQLEYANEEVVKSEIIDRLFTLLSLNTVFNHSYHDELKKHLDKKVSNGEREINGSDFVLIRKLQYHYKQFFIDIQVLPEDIFKEVVGASYDEFYSFSATLRAFADYFIELARSYRTVADEVGRPEYERNFLMSEYMEWSVCCLKHQTLSWFQVISKLDRKTFDKLLSYYLDIYSDNTKENFISNSFCGDGFFPPLTLVSESIIYSPHALKYFLVTNNVLYSINKKNRKLFDEKVSPYLEPTLINQIEYLFSYFKEIKIRTNVRYSKSEIDMLILSEKENVCIALQVKTTIAPDSSRTVERVQSRTLEARKQIEIFETLTQSQKMDLINKQFGTSLSDVEIVNLIMVRSSAGSHKAWEINTTYRIVNYPLLANILCNKVNNKEYTIADLDAKITEAQYQLEKVSEWTIKYETLKIDSYEIELPNFVYEDEPILSLNLQTKKCFKYFNLADFD